MYCLTDEQIAFILDDIRRNGIETEDLQSNLLDHICCLIEQGLEENGDFGQFYSQTITAFYKRDLKEIEQETQLLLTFKNYYAMKKMMIASGAVSTAAFIAGCFFKIMYWPGAAAFLMLAFFVFSFMFLPLVFLLKNRETDNTRDKIVFALGTLSGILYCLSMLFQVQHWNGKHELWLFTLALTFFVFVPVYFFSGIRKPEKRLNTMVTTMLLIGVIGVEFTMTSLRPAKAVEQQGKITSARNNSGIPYSPKTDQ